MKKLFICLANSKKYTQRCVAGVELVRTAQPGYRYNIVRKNQTPGWLRPISRDGHGEVTAYLVDHIRLLDVVEVNGVSPHPQGFQTENMRFDGRRLKVIDTIAKRRVLLDKLLTINRPVLFGNRDKAVRVAEAAQLDYSLALIKPSGVEMFQATTSAGVPQVRGRFIYNDVTYDFPVTDINFSARFRVDSTLLDGCQNIYLTVSLGAEFEEWHYKLIAGVLYF